MAGTLLWLVALCGRPLLAFGGSQASTIRDVSGSLLTAIEPLQRVAHDGRAFTQGVLIKDGVVYESTGLVGRSSLRRVELCSGTVLQSIPLPADEFGEGLALVDETLYVLTWTTGVVHLYDRSTFEHLRDMTYDGEGWGLCHDGQHLAMSNGSTDIVFRNPSTFAVERTVTVTLNGTPIRALNELECIGNSIFANVWQEDVIFVVDAASGEVTRVLQDRGLLTDEEHESANVLNGVAWNPDTGDFWFTGKLWPAMFRVQWEGMSDTFGPPAPQASSSDGRCESTVSSTSPAAVSAAANVGISAASTAASLCFPVAAFAFSSVLTAPGFDYV